MKKIFKLLGIIVLSVIIGFSMAACDEDDEQGNNNSSLDGTWVYSEDGVNGKYVFDNGNFTASIDNVEYMKGTYSTSGSNLTMTVTQINGAIYGENATMMGLSTSKWYTEQEFKSTLIQFLVSNGNGLVTQSQVEAMFDEQFSDIFGSQTCTYSLSGNTLTLTFEGESTVLTRQ